MSIRFTKHKYKPEANLQAAFYHQCKTVGLHPYLEYSYNHCRFDCVIVEEDEIIAIIEVKRSPCQASSAKTRRQIEGYNYFSENTPFFVLSCNAEVHKIIAKVQQIRKRRKKKH